MKLDFFGKAVFTMASFAVVYGIFFFGIQLAFFPGRTLIEMIVLINSPGAMAAVVNVPSLFFSSVAAFVVFVMINRSPKPSKKMPKKKSAKKTKK